jgi:hypothetical protein
MDEDHLSAAWKDEIRLAGKFGVVQAVAESQGVDQPPHD